MSAFYWFTENEDPMVIKKRIEEQLMEEAKKMGAEIDPSE